MFSTAQFDIFRSETTLRWRRGLCKVSSLDRGLSFVILAQNGAGLLKHLYPNPTVLEGSHIVGDFGCSSDAVISEPLVERRQELPRFLESPEDVTRFGWFVSKCRCPITTNTSSTAPKSDGNMFEWSYLSPFTENPSEERFKESPSVFQRRNENQKVKHNLLSLIWTTTSVRSPHEA